MARTHALLPCLLSAAALLSEAPVVRAAAQTQAQVSLPDTGPGRLLSEWLLLCRTPTLDALTQWNRLHASEQTLKTDRPESLAQEDVSTCGDCGGLEPVEILTNTPTGVEIVARAPRLGVYLRAGLRIDGAGKVAGRGFDVVPPPLSTLPAELSDAAMNHNLAALVRRVADAGQFSGIVQVAHAGKIVVSQTAGHADRSRRTQITPATQFTIGSMGKMFTAVAIGQLVDQGKLSFDDKVGRFFPTYANRTVREQVTVGMLLSHTGGLGDFLARRTPAMMTAGLKRAADFVPLYEKDEPRFPPGTSWAYSNAGLALAGAIVEKAAGEDYPTYLRRHIFAPAGMKNSDPNNIPHKDPRMVTPYTKQGENGPTPDWQVAPADIGSPAGGALSTAEDLLRFADALRAGKLVSKGTFAQMIVNRRKGPGRGYGYGLTLGEFYGHKVAGHGGGYPGVNAELHIFLDSDAPYSVVVLANQDPPAAELVGTHAAALVGSPAARLRR